MQLQVRSATFSSCNGVLGFPFSLVIIDQLIAMNFGLKCDGFSILQTSSQHFPFFHSTSQLFQSTLSVETFTTVSNNSASDVGLFVGDSDEDICLAMIVRDTFIHLLLYRILWFIRWRQWWRNLSRHDVHTSFAVSSFSYISVADSLKMVTKISAAPHHATPTGDLTPVSTCSGE